MKELLISNPHFKNFSLSPFNLTNLSENELEGFQWLVKLLTLEVWDEEIQESPELYSARNIYSSLFQALKQNNPNVSSDFLYQELKQKLFTCWISNSQFQQIKSPKNQQTVFYSYCETSGSRDNLEYLNLPDARKCQYYTPSYFCFPSLEKITEFLLAQEINANKACNEFQKTLENGYNYNSTIFLKTQDLPINVSSFRSHYRWYKTKNHFELRINSLNKEIITPKLHDSIYSIHHDLESRKIRILKISFTFEVRAFEQYSEKEEKEIDGQKFVREEKKERQILDWTLCLNNKYEPFQFSIEIPIMEKRINFLTNEK